MEKKFLAEYKKLNAAQKLAVDTIDGPVLVVAGPGTGKTQLLSMRVANIIRQTDTDPSNILCLTFTDNAARNMRERLEGIIGQPAYHVAIHTFHSFGSEIINQLPDYFAGRQLLQQVDELGRYELLRTIFEQLPHSNPLSTKIGEDFIFLYDTLEIISWLKQNAITPAELHEIIAANQRFMESTEPELAKAFAATPSPKSFIAYKSLLETIRGRQTDKNFYGFPQYAAECAAELEAAIDQIEPEGRYAPAMTAWRNSWCVKSAKGEHVFKDAGKNIRKMHALANVYEQLLEAMSQQGLYDFDDMIIETVQAMEMSAELSLSLQERYQYILVDEFQDTNKAQLRMLESLTNNPVNEGRPNIMAVGDDDQAIYAFQGAEVSNIVAFTRLYQEPTIITLEENYRSSPKILEASFAIAGQISDRLDSALPSVHKQIRAQVQYPKSTFEHLVFASELAQYEWIAGEAERLVKGGLPPEGIAIIAPRHRYLERLMPYLGKKKLPVAYERREDILSAPIIKELLTMAELIAALADNLQDRVDVLISEVLAYDFWELPAETLVAISLECYNKNSHWLPLLSKHSDKKIHQITNWFVGLAKKSRLEPMEYVLDQLIGNENDAVDSEYGDSIRSGKVNPKFVSPFRQFHFGGQLYEQHTDIYLSLLGQLSTLRLRLRQWQPNKTLYIKDVAEFVQLHRRAGLKIIDTNPHTQTTNAVQVMTAYKAKGLEFEVVFLINAQDEIWGPTAKSRSPNISLPKNLPLAPASDDDNDKLRLLFVSLTRAKHTLFISSYTHSLENRLSPGLSYIGGNQPESESVHSAFKPKLIDRPVTAEAEEILATDWSYRFRQVIADKRTLLEPILSDYKLSVTHLNNFTDVAGGGPWYFFVHNLLRFPEALSPSAAYGDAVHKTLQWTQGELKVHGELPSALKMHTFFVDILGRKHLRNNDYHHLERRGKEALAKYFKARGQEIKAGDLFERGFHNEGVLIGGARLSGKIDKLSIKDGSANVIDFKTGKPATTWQGKNEYEKIKLHKYRQQLLFYKLLVENSASFHKRAQVKRGALEFIEADEHGRLVDNLEIEFLEEELQTFSRLIITVWQHIISLNFPAISNYARTLKGIKQFEQDLIEDKI